MKKAKKVFRFQTDVEVTIEINTGKMIKPGPSRYFEQFFQNLVEDPVSLRAFLLIYIIESCWNNLTGDILADMGISDSEDNYILQTAQKCDKQVYDYYRELFDRAAKINDNPKIPRAKKIIRATAEKEKIITLINERLTKRLKTFNYQFYRLPNTGEEKEKFIEISSLPGPVKFG